MAGPVESQCEWGWKKSHKQRPGLKKDQNALRKYLRVHFDQIMSGLAKFPSPITNLQQMSEIINYVAISRLNRKNCHKQLDIATVRKGIMVHIFANQEIRHLRYGERLGQTVKITQAQNLKGLKFQAKVFVFYSLFEL